MVLYNFNVNKFFINFRFLDFIKMSLKSKVTCFQCSKILNNPIELPCRDTICSNHLQEANCIKENKIKCLKCNQTFSIRDNNNFHCNQLVK